MNEFRYWISTILIAVIVVLVYHIIISSLQENMTNPELIFYGMPGGPMPPNKKDVDYNKKITNNAYIYDYRSKGYKALKNENGDNISLDDINFSDPKILDLVNKYRARGNQSQLTGQQLIELAKKFGYKVVGNENIQPVKKMGKLNRELFNNNYEFKSLFINNMTTDELFS